MNSNLAYDVYRQTNVSVESPQKLVEMMYEGIMRFAGNAKRSIDKNDIEKRVYWINRASDIFTELITNIDFERGGDVAYYLNGLYAHQIKLLAEANIKNSTHELDTVIRVAKGLLEAWREIHK